MKTMVRTLLSLIVAFGLLAVVQAAEEKKEGKEVTLKGIICCSKCCLKQTDDCGNAITVKVDDKDVTYFFDDKGKAESYHKKFCTKGKSITGSVTGVVSEKDGKKIITPAKDGVKFD